MNQILILCLLTVLVPGIMAGCSEKGPAVAVEQPLQDMITQTGDQAQKAMEEAKSSAAEAVQTEAGGVPADMKEQLQDVRGATDTLKTDAELAALAKEDVAAPEGPDQVIPALTEQEVKDLAGAGAEGAMRELDQALTDLSSEAVDTTSEVAQADSVAGTTVTETGTVASDEASSASEVNAPTVADVAGTINGTATAASANTVPEKV